MHLLFTSPTSASAQPDHLAIVRVTNVQLMDSALLVATWDPDEPRLVAVNEPGAGWRVRSAFFAPLVEFEGLTWHDVFVVTDERRIPENATRVDVREDPDRA